MSPGSCCSALGDFRGEFCRRDFLDSCATAAMSGKSAESSEVDERRRLLRRGRAIEQMAGRRRGAQSLAPTLQFSLSPTASDPEYTSACVLPLSPLRATSSKILPLSVHSPPPLHPHGSTMPYLQDLFRHTRTIQAASTQCPCSSYTARSTPQYQHTSSSHRCVHRRISFPNTCSDPGPFH